mmetsp:Transcript_14627/g.55291  ORF Transcript_14627/g.55291 Transcript_14627/m.55291 type:complete len:105 (-) Transcript_14627:629-943(-)
MSGCISATLDHTTIRPYETLLPALKGRLAPGRKQPTFPTQRRFGPNQALNSSKDLLRPYGSKTKCTIMTKVTMKMKGPQVFRKAPKLTYCPRNTSQNASANMFQ